MCAPLCRGVAHVRALARRYVVGPPFGPHHNGHMVKAKVKRSTTDKRVGTKEQMHNGKMGGRKRANG
jgi:hypothetical protein